MCTSLTTLDHRCIAATEQESSCHKKHTSKAEGSHIWAPSELDCKMSAELTTKSTCMHTHMHGERLRGRNRVFSPDARLRGVFFVTSGEGERRQEEPLKQQWKAMEPRPEQSRSWTLSTVYNCLLPSETKPAFSFSPNKAWTQTCVRFRIKQEQIRTGFTTRVENVPVSLWWPNFETASTLLGNGVLGG